MRSSIALLIIAAALGACTGSDTASPIAHTDALQAQASAWCARTGKSDRFCEASFRYFYGYRDDNEVSASDQALCLSDMAESVRASDGWRCPASCDAIWLADGESGPIWP